MRYKSTNIAIALAIATSLGISGVLIVTAYSQAPSPVSASGGQAPPPRPSPYPQHPPADPVVLEQGRGLYSVRCAFCHGSDARGGESGPNLLRSGIVLGDQNGELIAPVVQNGRIPQGMPRFDLDIAQIQQIATFLHSFPVSGNERGRNAPITIPVGDASAGKIAFEASCASCHSVTGDLKGIGSRIPEPKMLQQTWLMPGTRGSSPDIKAPHKTVTITTPAGDKVEGPLVRIDDFYVTVALADGDSRTFLRDADKPLVQVHNPLEGHQKLLPTYTDKSIHDITAYLGMVK